MRAMRLHQAFMMPATVPFLSPYSHFAATYWTSLGFYIRKATVRDSGPPKQSLRMTTETVQSKVKRRKKKRSARQIMKDNWITNHRDKNPFSSFLALLRRHDVFLLQSVWFPLTKGFVQSKRNIFFTDHLTEVIFVISCRWQKHPPVATSLWLAHPPLIGQERLEFLGLVMPHPCGHIKHKLNNLCKYD